MEDMELETVKALNDALAKFRGQVKAIKKDSANTAFMNNGKPSKYASLDAIWEEVQKPLSANGLSIIQNAKMVGDTFTMQVPTKVNGQSAMKEVVGCSVQVDTEIRHSGGGVIHLEGVPLPCEFNVHKIGGAITYGKRYGIASALGLSTDEDDDGNSVALETTVKQNVTFNKTANAVKKATTPTYSQSEVEKFVKYVGTLTLENSMKVWDKVIKYNHPEVNKAFDKAMKEKGLMISEDGGRIVPVPEKGEEVNE